MIDEISVLKTEQLERIKQRDAFLNLNVVAVGVVATVALQAKKNAPFWLVVPWVTLIMGWAYLSNDDKVSAIARHLANAAAGGSVQRAWENGPKGMLPRSVRRVADATVYAASFVLPTPVAVVMYLINDDHHSGWAAVVMLLVVAQLAATAGLAAAYILSVRRR